MNITVKAQRKDTKLVNKENVQKHLTTQKIPC